jgi:hypothetical protein
MRWDAPARTRADISDKKMPDRKMRDAIYLSGIFLSAAS